jgi:hypothetical protein
MAGRTPVQASIVILALAAAVGMYQWWFSAERQIHRVLAAVPAALNHEQPDTGLAALTAVAALQALLALDVALDPGGGVPPIVGRQDVVSAAARARTATPRLRVQFFDNQVTLQHDAAATATLTAQVVTVDPSGAELAEAYDVEATLEKQDGAWVVTKARRVRGIAGG